MTSTRSIRAEANGYAEDARGLASQAIESTRDYANQAFDRAGTKFRDLRSSAKDMASRGYSSMGEYAQATRGYIAEEPVKTALIAAAIGAAIAGLVIALRRSNTTTRY